MTDLRSSSSVVDGTTGAAAATVSTGVDATTTGAATGATTGALAALAAFTGLAASTTGATTATSTTSFLAAGLRATDLAGAELIIPDTEEGFDDI